MKPKLSATLLLLIVVLLQFQTVEGAKNHDAFSILSKLAALRCHNLRNGSIEEATCSKGDDACLDKVLLTVDPKNPSFSPY